MPHCPLNEAAPLPLLKRRCEKSTLLYIHCLHLKYVFVLMPHKSLAAIFIPEPLDLWLGELRDCPGVVGALDEPGSCCSFVGWGWAKHMSGLKDHSFLSAFSSPFTWGLRLSGSHHKPLELETPAQQGNCAGITVVWETGVATFWYEFLFCDVFVFFFLNN